MIQQYGAYRRTSSVNFWRIDELGIQNHPNLHLVEYDLTDLGAGIALALAGGQQAPQDALEWLFGS